MKSIVYAAVAASILATPFASFAQSSESLTREQVRNELVQLEQNGYKPETNDAQYPANVQAAVQRSQPAQQVLTNADTSGYGAASSGMQQSGQRTTTRAIDSLYFGGQ